MGFFDQIIEFLVPLVIFLAFTVGPRLLEQFGKSRDEDEERPQQPASEEQRRIQEEIRRRIQRNQAQQRAPQRQSSENAEPPQLATQRPQRNYDPTRSEGNQDPSRPTTPQAASAVPMSDGEDQLKRLAEAREAAERTQREIESARRKAQSILSKTPSGRSPTRSSAYASVPTSELSLRSIRQATRNPARLREAIILNEVLSPPVSLRKQNQS